MLEFGMGLSVANCPAGDFRAAFLPRDSVDSLLKSNGMSTRAVSHWAVHFSSHCERSRGRSGPTFLHRRPRLKSALGGCITADGVSGRPLRRTGEIIVVAGRNNCRWSDAVDKCVRDAEAEALLG